MLSLSPHLSSHFIVMQVKSRSSVISILQSVYKAPRLLFSISEVIAASTPCPIVCHFSLFLHLSARTSGNVTLSALMRDFVCDGSGTNGVNESCFSSGYKKSIPLEVRIQKNWLEMKKISSCNFFSDTVQWIQSCLLAFTIVREITIVLSKQDDLITDTH